MAAQDLNGDPFTPTGTANCRVVKAADYIGQGRLFPIKSTVSVDEGNLVGIDSNGQVVLADHQAGVKARGVAVFTDGLATKAARVGVAGLTVKCAIARKAVCDGFNGLTIGGDVYAGNTANAGKTTQSAPATDTYHYHPLGFAISASAVDFEVGHAWLKYQTVANTTAAVLA